MGLGIAEIIGLLASLLALILTIVAMAIQNWLSDYATDKGYKNIYGPYETCTYLRSKKLFCISGRQFVVAAAVLLTIGFLAILITTILIILFIFVGKCKTRTVKILTIIFGFIAGIFLLISFAVWVGMWHSLYRKTEQFGAGPWLTLVAAIVSIITGCIAVVFVPAAAQFQL